ncbi:hypothetical protein INT45_008357 [Circinella minor]|uniref:Homing endonuclease LAGLIDADG domain-containing protein n=1 Tax=Circinella minor TaxID=1195481 RepID=A0A8H7RXP2_9FUNG|nr:hypothetical protein INT45_008357 [Circinella minor]
MFTNKSLSAYISGFTQADGNFHIALEKATKSTLGLRVKPKFSLSQHISAKPFFEYLKTHLDVGYVYTSRSDVNFSVNSLPQIKNKILPLFDEYPLRDGKLNSYLRFKQVVKMMDNKQHLTKEGLAKIIHISYSMNPIGSLRTEENKLKLLKSIGYDQEIYLENLSIPNLSPINPDFVSGLTDGDGSFFISFRSNGRVTPSYTVIQDNSCRNVLEELVRYFNCGKVYDLKSNSCRFQVENLDDIINKVIPHFNNYLLLTEKKTHFEIFSKACELMQSNSHKTQEGFLELINLAYDMNKDGKGRKLSKDEFIEFMRSKSKLPLDTNNFDKTNITSNLSLIGSS